MKFQEQLDKFLKTATPGELLEFQFLLEHPEYEHFPVTMKEFINNPKYTLPEDRPRPNNEKILIDFFDSGETFEEFEKLGKYEELLYIAGIGSGKSFLSSKSIQYIIYRLLCLKNPQEYFHLGLNSSIAFMNLSTSFSQAKDVVFGEINNRILNSPWFQSYYPPDPKIKSVLRFPKNIYILPVGSNEEAPLGYNIFGAVIDEASFHTLTKDKDYAEEAYNQIKKRIRSRYFDYGKLFIITSPRYTMDFAERKFREDDNPNILKRRVPLWDAIPAERFSGKKFDVGDYIVEMKGTMVPIEYENEFKQNPERAMRDYGAQPSMAIESFFKNPNVITQKVNTKRQHPWSDRNNDFYEWFWNRRNTKDYDNRQYFIHIDLALNRGGKGDFCGFAMGCFDGWQEIMTPTGKIEKRPKIHIAYMDRIGAGSGEEINFEDIRKRIYRLKEIGYNIKLITLDSWNSADFIQMMKSSGFKAEMFSVDRNPEAYYALKAALLDGRLDYYYFKPLVEELQMLEELKGSKIDHPRLGHKDLSDSVAAVCYHSAKGKSGIGIYFGK